MKQSGTKVAHVLLAKLKNNHLASGGGMCEWREAHHNNAAAAPSAAAADTKERRPTDGIDGDCEGALGTAVAPFAQQQYF